MYVRFPKSKQHWSFVCTLYLAMHEYCLRLNVSQSSPLAIDNLIILYWHLLARESLSASFAKGNKLQSGVELIISRRGTCLGFPEKCVHRTAVRQLCRELYHRAHSLSAFYGEIARTCHRGSRRQEGSPRNPREWVAGTATVTTIVWKTLSRLCWRFFKS